MNFNTPSRGKRSIVVSITLLCIAIAVIVISLNTGTIRLSPVAVLQTLLGNGSSDDQIVLFDYRLPRILVTVLAGQDLVLPERPCKGSPAIHWRTRVFWDYMRGQHLD